MASRTGLIVAVPAWQADPVDAANRGNAARISLPQCSAKLTFSVFGKRSVK
jgi:hypothetical protein